MVPHVFQHNHPAIFATKERKEKQNKQNNHRQPLPTALEEQQARKTAVSQTKKKWKNEAHFDYLPPSVSEPVGKVLYCNRPQLPPKIKLIP